MPKNGFRGFSNENGSLSDLLLQERNATIDHLATKAQLLSDTYEGVGKAQWALVVEWLKAHKIPEPSDIHSSGGPNGTR